MSTPLPPQYPLCEPPALLPFACSLADLEPSIEQLSAAPSNLRQTLDGISPTQLDTKYRNWTLRQITHHIADSHLNALVRCKWALTEPAPTIKAYDENLWTDLRFAKTADIGLSLNQLDATHESWIALIRTLGMDKLNRTFVHPESGEHVRLADMIPHYGWHAAHHTAQIRWRLDHPTEHPVAN